VAALLAGYQASTSHKPQRGCARPSDLIITAKSKTTCSIRN
jgi:hypothetical protein